jgi:hypothetical protein
MKHIAGSGKGKQMKCRKCGEKLIRGNGFCIRCGQPAGKTMRILWISLAALLGAAGIFLLLSLTGVIPVFTGGDGGGDDLFAQIASANYLELSGEDGGATGEMLIRGEAEEAVWEVAFNADYADSEPAWADNALGEPVTLSVRERKDGAEISIPKERIEPGMPYTVTLNDGVHFTMAALENARAVTFIPSREDIELFEYKDNIYELSANEAQVVDENTLRIVSNRNVREGDILVVPTEDGTGPAALRVAGVQPDGTVRTAEPAMEEIFEQLEISGTYAMDPDDFVLDEEAVEKQVRESVFFDSLVRTVYAAGEDKDEIKIKVEKLPKSDNTLNVRIKIEMDSGLTFIIELGLKLNANVDVVKTLVYDISCDTLTTVDISLGYNGDKKLSDLPKNDPLGWSKKDIQKIEDELRKQGNWILRLGYIPVPLPGPAYLTVEVDAFVSFDGSVDIDLSSGLTFANKTGVILGPGKFKPYSTKKTTMDIDRVIGKVKLGAKAGLKISVLFSVLKAAEAGIELEGGPYLEGVFAVAYIWNDKIRLDDHIFGYFEGGLYGEASLVAKLNLLVRKYKFERVLTKPDTKWRLFDFGQRKYLDSISAVTKQISVAHHTARLPEIRLEYFNVIKNEMEVTVAKIGDLEFTCPDGISCRADADGNITFNGDIPDRFTLAVGHKDTDRTLTLECIKETKQVMPGGAGNTSGNLANEGIAAISDGWIYYRSSDGPIHKMREDGSGDTRLNDGDCRFINVVGEWLYYIDDGDICRMRTDGAERMRVLEGGYYSLAVTDGWLYVLSDGKISRMRTDGADMQTLPVDNREFVESFSVEGDTVVYYSHTDAEDEDGYPIQLVRVKRMNTDGSGDAVIDGTTYANGRGDWFSSVQTDDGVMYSTFGGGPDIVIRKADLSGGAVQNIDPLGRDVYTGLNVYDGRLYVSVSDYTNEVSMLASTDMAGGNPKILRTADEPDAFLGSICIAGHWLFYLDYWGLQIIDLNEEGVESFGENYLVPGSDSRYITVADLAGFNANTARLARNEIFARYGYTFADTGLQAYFNSQSWYRSNPGCNKDNPPTLNPYEEHNIGVIRDYEAGLGSGDAGQESGAVADAELTGTWVVDDTSVEDARNMTITFAADGTVTVSRAFNGMLRYDYGSRFRMERTGTYQITSSRNGVIEGSFTMPENNMGGFHLRLENNILYVETQERFHLGPDPSQYIILACKRS